MTYIQRYNSILLHHLVCSRGLPGVMVTPTVSYTNFFPNPSGSLIPRANNNNNNNNNNNDNRLFLMKMGSTRSHSGLLLFSCF